MTCGQIAAHLTLVMALLAVGCRTADTPDARLRSGEGISVGGIGKVTVVPDTALVHLGVELRAPSLVDVTAQASRQMSAVLERVKALGVSDRDITTVTYVVEPVTSARRPEEESARITGYRVVNVVQLRVRDLAAVGRVVEAAMAAGGTTIRGVRFTVADPARPEADARALAVRDAQARANQLAEAAGLRLGELISLTEGVPPLRPGVERYGAAVGAVMAPGPVEPGQLEIVVNVTARYRLAR